MLEKIIYRLCPKSLLLKKWVLTLDPRRQSTLFSILRGSDTQSGKCTRCKKITKMLRYIITNHVGKKNSYMSTDVLRVPEVTNILEKEYINNQHWVEHVSAASYVIFKNHPDPYVREYWGSINRVINGKIKRIKKELAKQEAIDKMISKYLDIYTKRNV